jgi:hypothetical protein
MFKLKTIVYNTLGSLVLFAPFILSFYLISVLSSGNMPIFACIVLYILILVVACLIVFGIFFLINDSICENDISIAVYRDYLFSINRVKLIYHSDYGNFVCIINKDSSEINIYNQKYFMLEKFDYVFFSGNIEDATNRIKKVIEDEMVKRNNYKKQKDNKSDVLKKWDGYLDTAGKRDDKINKILR